MKTSFAVGVLLTLLAILFGAVVSVVVLLNTERVDAACTLVDAYELLSGDVAPMDGRRLDDIGSLPESDQVCVRKLYGIRVTSGTSEATFSPHMLTTIPQWLVLIGRTWAALWGW